MIFPPFSVIYKCYCVLWVWFSGIAPQPSVILMHEGLFSAIYFQLDLGGLALRSPKLINKLLQPQSTTHSNIIR